MPGLTRHQLKEDRVRTAFEDYEAFAKDHYKEIISYFAIAVVIAAAVFGVKYVLANADGTANTKLGAALDTYHAVVGPASPQNPGLQSFATDQEKYTKALQEFREVDNVTGIEKMLPRNKPMRLAQYYAALCSAHLGNESGAVKALEDLSRDSDASVASLAKLALAGEYVKTGKTQDAIKIYKELSEHPTKTVPSVTARLALAGIYRGTQPALARQIYDQLGKEFQDDSTLATELKKQASSLPQ